MLSPLQNEAMLRRTAALPVSYGAALTWGHEDQASEEIFGAGGGNSRDGGTPPAARMVTVATGIIPALEVNSAITVDGTVRRIRALKQDEDGGLTQILLAARTHVISIYRQTAAATTERGRRSAGWTLIDDGIEANLEPDSGELRGMMAAQEAESRWKGFIPPGIIVEENDGVLVTTGWGPERFRIAFVAAHGPEWDTEVDIEQTENVFP